MPTMALEDIFRKEAKRFVRRGQKICGYCDGAASAEQVAGLVNRLDAERQLARVKSFRYDPNRHIALLQRLKDLQAQEKGASSQGHA